jgi:uncharacterized repeat protein (TIGR01451 family)
VQEGPYMTFQKTATLLATASLLASLGASSIHADSYGNGGDQPKNDITINKEVKNPITNIYVENLGSADPTFSPGSSVVFRLTVKNTSNATVDKLTVSDTLPIYMSYETATGSAMTPSYVANDRVLTMSLDKVTAGESRTIEVTGKVAAKSAFAAGRSLFCVVNNAKVFETTNTNRGDDDTAQFCIQTEVAGAQNLPVAGANDLFTLIPFLSLGGMGTFMLMKKSA